MGINLEICWIYIHGAQLLGLEIVAAGKSSEYDFVWNRETGNLTYTDGSGRTEHMPEMLDCWRYEGKETLEKRHQLLEKYEEVISADLCEMNLVSNVNRPETVYSILGLPDS